MMQVATRFERRQSNAENDNVVASTGAEVTKWRTGAEVTKCY